MSDTDPWTSGESVRFGDFTASEASTPTATDEGPDTSSNPAGSHRATEPSVFDTRSADDSEDRLAENVRKTAPPLPEHQEEATPEPKVELSPAEERYNEKLLSAREVPPGTPVPTMGPWAKTRFWLWRQGYTGRDFVVPPLSKKEHRLYQIKQAESELLIEELKLYIADLQIIGLTLNSKGGAGKSPLAVHLSTVLDWAIELLVVLLDANQFDGTVCGMMGIGRQDTKSLRYVADHLNDFRTYKALTTSLGRSMQPGNRVHVVASDPGSPDFNILEVLRVFQKLSLGCKAIVADGGNGNSDQLPVNRAAAMAATDLLFAALAGERSPSIERVPSTMAHVIGNGLGDKVRRGFTVVNATKPTDTKSDIMFQLEEAVGRLKKGDLSLEAQGHMPDGPLTLDYFGIEPRRVYLIPYDGYVNGGHPANAKLLQIDTRNAFLELLVGIAAQRSPSTDLQGMIKDLTPPQANLGIAHATPQAAGRGL